ncbi:heme-copper oxidase subunit III [Polymorphospora sp. NPDC051019]|uniref:cytochrome c oxidase subunit 3 n=1 Tax=unclassified Polymorphospora TaxID=2685497 RepID=UPI0033F8BD39
MTPPGGITATTSPEALSTELPVGRSTGWWGMVLFVTTEATLFACLLGSYFYLRFQYGPQWPPGDIPDPALLRPLVMTAVLVPSSLPMLWAERGLRRGQLWRVRAGLTASMLLGLTFLALQATEYAELLTEFTLTTNAYGSLFYVITGFHGLHVLIGATMIAWALTTTRGGLDARRDDRVRNVAIYWHFVDIVWLGILFTIYLSPRL